MGKITYRMLLQNLPKGFSNKEIQEHFSKEYRRITKQDLPWQCFTRAASAFRAVYMKKYTRSIKNMMKSSCSFLDHKVNVTLSSAAVVAGSTPSATPPSGSESGSSTTAPSTPPPSGSKSGSTRKPYAALNRVQKYRRKKAFMAAIANCDREEKEMMNSVVVTKTTSDEFSYSFEYVLKLIAVLDFSKTKYEQWRALEHPKKTPCWQTVLEYRDNKFPDAKF